MKLPFGVSQFTTWTQTFAQDVQLYRDAKVEFMEVCEAKLPRTRPENALRRLAESGLKVSSVQPRIHSPFPNSLRATPVWPVERMKRLHQSIRLFGHCFPGTTLVLNTGLAPGGDFNSATRVVIEEFKIASQRAADHGVRLALEPLNAIYMNTDTFIVSLIQAERIIDAVDNPVFGLAADLWHIWEEQNLLRSLRRFAGRIFCVHVSDWRTPHAFGDRLLPGMGQIPIAPLIKAIRRTGYDGIYTLEIFSDLRLSDSLWAHPRRAVIEGRRAFAKIWNSI